MKRMILILLLTIGVLQVKAQGIGSIFTQQETKVKIMAQQIAAYETYLHYLKSGYASTKNGLNTVHELKDGTYSLHENYFSSLGKVAPAVRNNPKIKCIADLLGQIESVFDGAIYWQKNKAILSSDEIGNMQSVYNHLLYDCNQDLEELSLVVTDGKLQMKDEERIQKVDQLYSDMEQKYRFSRSYCDRAYALAANRDADKQGMQTLKKMYDLNQ